MDPGSNLSSEGGIQSMLADQDLVWTEETASHGGGHFPGFLLPPLVVIFIGILLGLFTSGLFITWSVTASSDPLAGNSISGELQSDQPGSDSSLASQYVQYPYQTGGGPVLSGIFTSEVMFWATSIIAWSTTSGIDPNFIATLMQIESCGDPEAVSIAGASGLFQVMPFHFDPTENPFDPATNAMRGLDYFQRSLQASNGNTRLAFAGYNGGIGMIDQPEENWAIETQHYVYWGSGIFQDAVSQVGSSQRLQEWLAAGGSSLCQQASSRLGIQP
jgi:hypothetical protein